MKKRRVLKYYIANMVLHLIGISLLFMAFNTYHKMIALGVLAYTLGLRHAFDADHIVSIDN
ncbi:MAG: hypothetical protein ACK5LJ_16005, partial [Paracoccus sp. (in: a-proteobacteria)]